MPQPTITVRSNAGAFVVAFKQMSHRIQNIFVDSIPKRIADKLKVDVRKKINERAFWERNYQFVHSVVAQHKGHGSYNVTSNYEGALPAEEGSKPHKVAFRKLSKGWIMAHGWSGGQSGYQYYSFGTFNHPGSRGLHAFRDAWEQNVLHEADIGKLKNDMDGMAKPFFNIPEHMRK